VFAHAPDGGLNPATDCVIAITTIELAAHALGAGACWAGFFTRAAAKYAPLIEALALSEGHKVRAALMLGTPRYRYLRVPPRHEPRLRRL
jgi:nitroreductase